MRRDENSKRRINGYAIVWCLLMIIVALTFRIQSSDLVLSALTLVISLHYYAYVADTCIYRLEMPWHPLQIVTWFIFPLLIAYFYIFLIPLLKGTTFVIIASIIFGVATITAAFSAYRVCAIDPVDYYVIKTQEAPIEKVFCYICSTHVQKESRHCILCKKCVENFDHHCKWLNTCIGKRNYRYFLGVVGSVSVQTTLAFVITIILIVQSFVESDDFDSRVNKSNVVTINNPGSVIALFIGLVFLFPLVLLVWQLLCFHIMLVSKGMTTYEFIMGQHKRQQERVRKRQASGPVATTGASVRRSLSDNGVEMNSNPSRSIRPVSSNTNYQRTTAAPAPAKIAKKVQASDEDEDVRHVEVARRAQASSV